jgi:predicted ATPase
MTGERGIAAASRAAVQITNGRGGHLGHGLLLSLPSRGSVVLTCDHVVAGSTADLRVVPPRDRDDGHRRLRASYDEKASRPKRDVAVLTLERDVDVANPLLHVPDPVHYNGRLDARALAPGSKTDNFGVVLEAATRSFEADGYTLAPAFTLGSPQDVRKGVSGSPVLCEEGVVGLIHFARPESIKTGRLGALNPLSAWVDGLPELEVLLQPFTCWGLRRRAAVLRAVNVAERGPLKLRGRYMADVYQPRQVDEENAHKVFENGGLLCLVGQKNSGKTRLICQLLKQHDDALAIFPEAMAPPDELGDDSVFLDRDVVLVFENVHTAVDAWKPLHWWQTFKNVADHTVVILTSRNDADWKRVKKGQEALLGLLEHRCDLFLSPQEGPSLSNEDGRAIAKQIGMPDPEFEARFDGTPGSLFDDEDLPPATTSETLPPGDLRGTAIGAVADDELPGSAPTNLPELSSSFFGRERERAEVGKKLDRHRLVTITGAPGVGKTRLALQVATECAERFPDGVWFVDLTVLAEGAFVPTNVAASIGQPELASVAEHDELVRYLRARRALLIFDGAERVADATAELVAELTAGGVRRLKVLVASEQPLGLRWEQQFSVPPLSGAPAAPDDARSPAQRLFLDRVGRPDLEAALTDDDLARIDALCTNLHGNPAALEIAAAGVRDAGLEHVGSALGNRAPDAGAALDAATEHALEQLPAARVDLFSRLGVFPDWFTLDAARDVAADADGETGSVAAGLRDLVDHALVRIDHRDPDAERYQLLPGVRDLARARLRAHPDAETTRRRHAEHYLALAEQGAPRLDGRASSQWVERLMRERPNFRAALRWAIASQNRMLGWRLGQALWYLMVIRSRFAEGRRWLGELLALAPSGRPDELSDEEARALGDVLTAAAYLAYHQGDYDDARDYDERAMAARRPPLGPEHADSFNLLGLVARRQGNFDVAVRWLTQAVMVSEEHRDVQRLADQLNSLANTIRESCGDLDNAIELQERSLTLYARIGSDRGCAMVQCDLAWVLADMGELPEARKQFERSLATRTRIGDAQGEGQSVNGLGRVDRMEGDYDSAIARHEEARDMFDQIGDELRVAESLELLGVAHRAGGDDVAGRRLIRRADKVRAQIGAPRPPSALVDVEGEPPRELVEA